MTRALITLLTVAFAFVSNAADQDSNARRHTYPQDGLWKPISAALAGSKMPKSELSAITLRISGASYEVSVMGEKRPDQGTRRPDERTTPKRTTPKRTTITSTNGPNKGKTFLGIYEVTDTNSFRVCYDLSGIAFPAKLESTVESAHYLVEYRRSEAKPAAKADVQVEERVGAHEQRGLRLMDQRVPAGLTLRQQYRRVRRPNVDAL